MDAVVAKAFGLSLLALPNTIKRVPWALDVAECGNRGSAPLHELRLRRERRGKVVMAHVELSERTVALSSLFIRRRARRA